jgi:hypothetical protein
MQKNMLLAVLSVWVGGSAGLAVAFFIWPDVVASLKPLGVILTTAVGIPVTILTGVKIWLEIEEKLSARSKSQAHTQVSPKSQEPEKPPEYQVNYR